MPTHIPASKTKRYLVLREYNHPEFGKWKEGELVRLEAQAGFMYTSQRVVMPLSVAIKEKLYPPKPKDTVVEKLKKAVLGAEESSALVDKSKGKAEDKAGEEGKKSFLNNKLREAVQEKRQETEAADSTKKDDDSKTKAKISADKLAKIKAGGK